MKHKHDYCDDCGEPHSNDRYDLCPKCEEEEVVMKYTNIVGNPVDGFKCYGIFDDLQDAIDWQDGCDESCWVVELEVEDEVSTL